MVSTKIPIVVWVPDLASNPWQLSHSSTRVLRADAPPRASQHWLTLGQLGGRKGGRKPKKHARTTKKQVKNDPDFSKKVDQITVGTQLWRSEVKLTKNTNKKNITWEIAMVVSYDNCLPNILGHRLGCIMCGAVFSTLSPGPWYLPTSNPS